MSKTYCKHCGCGSGEHYEDCFIVTQDPADFEPTTAVTPIAPLGLDELRKDFAERRAKAEEDRHTRTSIRKPQNVTVVLKPAEYEQLLLAESNFAELLKNSVVEVTIRVPKNAEAVDLTGFEGDLYTKLKKAFG